MRVHNVSLDFLLGGINGEMVVLIDLLLSILERPFEELQA